MTEHYYGCKRIQDVGIGVVNGGPTDGIHLKHSIYVSEKH